MLSLLSLKKQKRECKQDAHPALTNVETGKYGNVGSHSAAVSEQRSLGMSLAFRQTIEMFG